MLDNEGKTIIEKIKQAAEDMWGDNYEIENIVVEKAPFCLFNLYMCVCQRQYVRLSYDRSIIDIAIKVDGDYVWLTDLTDQKVVEGFASNKSENILCNFKVLDTVLRKLE